VGSYRTSLFPVAYNNSPTIGPGCVPDGDSLSCGLGAILIDNDTGSAELNTSKVSAWNREVNIVTVAPTNVNPSTTKVRQVNLFFYNIPSSGIGLPPADLFWSDVNFENPDIPLSHVIVGNQDLSQDDRTLRNVSLVVTTYQSSIPDYIYFRIHLTFPAETSLLNWILLSEVQLCGEEGMCVSMFPRSFTRLQQLQHAPPGMSHVPLRPRID